jgi:hypothetical protein
MNFVTNLRNRLRRKPMTDGDDFRRLTADTAAKEELRKLEAMGPGATGMISLERSREFHSGHSH